MAHFWSQKHHQTSRERPKTLLIVNVEINVSYTYMYESLITTREFFPNPLFQVRAGVAVADPSSAGPEAGTRPGQTPFHWRAHHPPHSQSDRDKVDRPVDLTCTFLGCGRKPESPEKTHADLEKMCKRHTDSGPAEN